MRAIIYPHKVRAVEGARNLMDGKAPYKGRSTAPRVAASEAAPADPDDYLARLAKHVPAESLAVLLLLAGQLQDHSLGWRLAALVFPALMAVMLDRERRSRLPLEVRPQGLIYDCFVVAAFVAWALGTTDLARNLIGIDQSEASLIVLVVAFGLGYWDDPLGARFERKSTTDGGTADSADSPRGRRGVRRPRRDNLQ